MIAWRISKAKWKDTAFTGEGAAHGGGRWNSRNTWMVYCSESQSLAALENLVHLNPPICFRYVVFKIEFADSLITTPGKPLPKDWQEEPATISSKRIGDKWIHNRESAVLKIPSAIIPDEFNYLLNPSHPHFKKIKIDQPKPFNFDPRLK